MAFVSEVRPAASSPPVELQRQPVPLVKSGPSRYRRGGSQHAIKETGRSHFAERDRKLRTDFNGNHVRPQDPNWQIMHGAVPVALTEAMVSIGWFTNC